MPNPDVLRIRLRLISQFDQLASRLDADDPEALDEAVDRLYGIALKADFGSMALVMRAMSKVLTEMQDELDGFRYNEGDEPD